MARPPGPGRAGNFVRDIAITLLVSALVDEFDLRPNLRTASRGPSASSVAAAALTEAGIGVALGHKGVEKIWRHYLPLFAGSRFAARTRFATGIPADYPGLFGTVCYEFQPELRGPPATKYVNDGSIKRNQRLRTHNHVHKTETAPARGRRIP